MSGICNIAGSRRRTARRTGLIAAATLVGLAGGAVAVAGPALALSAPAAARVALPDPVPTWTQYFTDDGPAGSTVTVPVRVWLAARPRGGGALRHRGFHAGNPRLRHVPHPGSVHCPFRRHVSPGRGRSGVGQVGRAEGSLHVRALRLPDRDGAEAQFRAAHFHPRLQPILRRPGHRVRAGERHLGSRVDWRGRDDRDRSGRRVVVRRSG
jgi:hypothetical protein